MPGPVEMGPLKQDFKSPPSSVLAVEGWAIIRTSFKEAEMDAQRRSVFTPDSAGQRCLLDQPAVRDIAIRLRAELVGAQILKPTAVAIQAIAFDKTPATNWKVTLRTKMR